MKHYIIVKFVEGSDVGALLEPVGAIFHETLRIPGVHGVVLKPSNSERPNRYDLMIEIGMDAEALPVYDDCEPHHTWKDQYGSEIAHKVIFDCE